MEHIQYMRNLCGLELDPMKEVYHEELAYLEGMRPYNADISMAAIIAMSSIPAIDIKNIHKMIKTLEEKFKIDSQLVEYEGHFIPFKSPLIRAWVSLYQRMQTN